MSEQEYVLGTASEELVRLGLQHRLWSAAAHEAWERAGVCVGSSVLDVGCGPGFASMDLAQLVGPEGRVFGVDESASFVSHADSMAEKLGRGWGVFARGDVMNLGSMVDERGLSGVFDVAYARWVMCFVPEPARVLAGVASALRPGGRLLVQDYFNYKHSMTMAPRREIFTRVIDRIDASWRAQGGDPDIVGRLPGLLEETGLRVDSIRARQRTARPGEPMWGWPDTFWKTFLPRLEELGFIGAEEAEEFRAMWSEVSAREDVFMALPTVYDVIASKPG